MGRTNGQIGSLVAERSLSQRDSPRRTVVVSLGKPRKVKGAQDWVCPFLIRGAGMRRLEYAYGLDAFQSLTMALEGIRHILDRSRLPLVWRGVLKDHSGFQRVIPLMPEASGTRRMERLVDSAVRDRLKEAQRKRRTAPATGRGEVRLKADPTLGARADLRS